MRESGDIVLCELGITQIFVLIHLDLIQELLLTWHRYFHKDTYYVFLKLVVGQGLLTSEDDFHLRQRRMIQPAFHRQRVQDYGRVMVKHAAALSEKWRDGAHVDINSEMMRLAL